MTNYNQIQMPSYEYHPQAYLLPALDLYDCMNQNNPQSVLPIKEAALNVEKELANG